MSRYGRYRGIVPAEYRHQKNEALFVSAALVVLFDRAPHEAVAQFGDVCERARWAMNRAIRSGSVLPIGELLLQR